LEKGILIEAKKKEMKACALKRRREEEHEKVGK